MSYSRSKTTAIYETISSGQQVLVKSGYAQYNCQKRVKGHYLTPLDYDRYFNERLAWYSQTCVTAAGDPNPQYQANDPISVNSLAPVEISDVFGPDIERCTNKVYAKFVDQMKDSAQNANNVLEAKQSIGQIISHVKAISGSIEAVRRGDIVGAAKKLGISIDGNTEKKIKRRAKQASDRWLELHFGWVPLVQDIGSSIDALQGTGKSSPYSFVDIKAGSGFSGNYSDSSTTYPALGLQDQTYDSYHWNGGVRMSGQVAVENPNIALANQMGFVNPLSVAWEAVPFSFVADWFSNAGQCLSAMSDFWGYQLHFGRTTSLVTNVYNHTFKRDQYGINPHNIKNEGYSVKFFRMNRVGGITSPVFRFTPLKGISIARGATAISLLVQQMRHG